MLEQWLEPDSVNFFLKHHLCKRQPFAKPQAAQSSTWIFKWNILDRLLANCAADTLAISRGKVVERLIPRDLSETRSLLGDGIGLVIRHAEQLDSALADLAHSLTETVPGKAHIQLFVTPAGTTDSAGIMTAKRFRRPDGGRQRLFLSRKYSRAPQTGTRLYPVSRRSIADGQRASNRRRLALHSNPLVARGQMHRRLTVHFYRCFSG
jgi:hypothetical protein